MTRSIPPSESRCWWRSLRWSAGLHFALLMGLVVQALWIPLPAFAPGAAARRVIEVEREAFLEEPLELEMQVDDRPWIARDAEDITHAQIDLSDPRWNDLLDEPQRQFETMADRQADRHASSLLSEQLMRSIDAAEQRSEEENLAELERLGGQLNKVSSEQGVDEVSGTIGRLFGAGDRAAAPQEVPAGPFDHSTAQPHDCRKEESPDGTVRYIVVMVDAKGRMEEIEVDEESGQQLYRTMQLIKSNPLLERVYRGVVMGILDKLLAPQ